MEKNYLQQIRDICKKYFEDFDFNFLIEKEDKYSFSLYLNGRFIMSVEYIKKEDVENFIYLFNKLCERFDFSYVLEFKDNREEEMNLFIK